MPRNFAADVDLLVKRPRQRFLLDNGNAFTGCRFTQTRYDGTRALGDDQRLVHRLSLIPNRNRKLVFVRDQYMGEAEISLEAGCNKRCVHSPSMLLRLGVAFHVAQLVFNLTAGHAKIALELPALITIIQQAQDKQQPGDSHRDVEDDAHPPGE